MENRCFSISIPTIDLIPQVDAVGMVSGKEGKIEVVYGKVGDVDQCINI